jgi:hypothetical protein
MPSPSITIAAPGNGDFVAPAFPVIGTVSDGVPNVMASLKSSLPNVAVLNQVVDSSTGSWNANFTVDPSNYPGDSTLTAAIVGMPVSTSIIIRIRP